MPAARKRRRHLPTVCGVTPKRRATAALLKPSVLARIMPARWTSAWGRVADRGNSVELMLLLVGELEWYQWVSAWHGSLPSLKPAENNTHLRDATLVGLDGC